jgi:hypothetical protein
MPDVTLDILAGDQSTLVQVDTLSRQLMSDIRALRAFSVRVATGPGPSGGKSPAVEHVGTLIVSGVFSATALRALREVIIAYVGRTKARAVTVRVGTTEVTLAGASSSDLSEIARQLSVIVENSQANVEKVN